MLTAYYDGLVGTQKEAVMASVLDTNLVLPGGLVENHKKRWAG
jgi:hypothetical protein